MARYSTVSFIAKNKWHEVHQPSIFPTISSLDWFIRRHKQRLVQEGQLILRRGASGSLLGPEFERIALDVLREESQKLLVHPDQAVNP